MNLVSLERLLRRDLAILLGVVAIVLLLLSAALSGTSEWLSGVLQNLGTEMIGVLVTFLLIDYLFLNAKKRLENLQPVVDQLLSQLRSSDLTEARQAAIEMLKQGIFFFEDLVDANLEGVNLAGMNLTNARMPGANLKNTNLERTHLRYADLKRANLEGANLQGAELYQANLEGATLSNADLQGRDRSADLELANLKGANLEGANLKGVSLARANLRGAQLSNAQFDQTTLLPDFSFWTPETDLRRFTDH